MTPHGEISGVLVWFFLIKGKNKVAGTVLV